MPTTSHPSRPKIPRPPTETSDRPPTLDLSIRPTVQALQLVIEVWIHSSEVRASGRRDGDIRERGAGTFFVAVHGEANQIW